LLTTHAPAKVNLTLAIHGRRADGYHDLTSLVAFATIGDSVSLDPAGPQGLTITGPFASGLATDGSNLVLRAIEHLNARRPLGKVGHFTLVKRLPVASGIGGGSADAAAALRLVARARGWPLHLPDVMEAARQTGADVPVCLASKARQITGTGEALGLPLKLPKLFAVIVNPGVAVSTAAVFAKLGLQPGQARTPVLQPQMGVGSWREDGPEDAGSLISGSLRGHGNDLEAAACQIQPVIEDALEALRATGSCRLARMSGSGATCFALFDDREQSLTAARSLAKAYPHWWIRATVLR
jgi:4-diphosphocytidyl-2-C-methyl-D-erythritol kinase